MKTSLSLLILLLGCNLLKSQNLVPNPSFENFAVGNCPDNLDQLNKATGWTSASAGSPDYFNGCSVWPGFPNQSVEVPSNFIGHQTARTGVAYAGIISSNYSAAIPAAEREYIQIQLTSPLTAGNLYKIKFYWSLADSSSAYVHEIGVFLSNSSTNASTFENLSVTPQVEQTGSPLNDMTNWVAFDKNYTAVGGEEYIVIGNFNGLSGTTTGTTSNPCSPPPFSLCQAYYYIDDVSVEATNSLNEYGFSDFKYYPNPTNGDISIDFGEIKAGVTATVINSIGQVILTEQYESAKKINLNIEASKGIYYMRLMTVSGEIAIRKIIIE